MNTSRLMKKINGLKKTSNAAEAAEADCMCSEEVVVPILQRSIYDQSIPRPPPMASRPASCPVCPVSAAMPNLADMVIDKVLVEYRFKGQQQHHASSNIPRITQEDKKIKRPLEAPKRLGVCEALKLAGFQSDWTKEKIARLRDTPDGAELVHKVDMEYRQLTGKGTLSEQDILSCYPNYLSTEKHNVELLLQMDAQQNILSVREKKSNKQKQNNKSKSKHKSKSKSKKQKAVKSKFNL